MSDNLYQEDLLDLYHHPHNFGHVNQPTCQIQEKNASCGDEISLEITVDTNQRITDIAFQGVGCCISIAAASKLTDYAKGKTIEELKQIDFPFMQQLIGATISPGRIKCVTLAAKALLNAIASLQR
jgi:nitrogen fixation NifU-like protein